MEFTFMGFEHCKFVVNRYCNNDNLAISIFSRTAGPICNVTVGIDDKLDDDKIAVKTYSENEGMDDWLYQNGYIENIPCFYINSGFVDIPVYKLTELGKKTFVA